MHIRDKDITSWIEESISKKKKRDMERHLSICGMCRRRLNAWNQCYDMLALLENNFQLEGLEEDVMLKIKAQKAGSVSGIPGLTIPKLILLLLLFVSVSSLYNPVSDISNWLSDYNANSLFIEGLDWVHQIKWPVMDIMNSIANAITGGFLSIVVAVSFIVGGTCFFAGDKRREKVKG